MKIIISDDRARLKQLFSGLSDVKEVQKIVNRSIKRTMKGVQTFAIRELRARKILKMTPKKWKDDVRIYFGGGSSSPVAEQYGKIWFTSYGQPLGRFFAKRKFAGIKQNKPAKGIRLYSVTVNKFGAPYLKDPKRTFIKQNPKGPVVFFRQGESRTPITKLVGPSLSEILQSESMVKPLENYISTRYNKEFESGVKFYALKAIERANKTK